MATAVSLDTSNALEQYLRDIRPIRLLTADEERELGNQLRAGREARQRLKRNHLTRAQAERLREKIRKADEARNELVTHNMRLVISVAWRYQNRGLPLSDLIQEGNIGLVKAANKYDVRRGVRFSTLAVWWIRQSITRALGDKSRTIRLSLHFTRQASELFRTRERLGQELGRSPSVDELSVAMKWPVAKVRHVLAAGQPPLDLDAPRGPKDSDDDALDFLPDEASPQPEDRAGEIMLRAELATLIDQLPVHEARVVRLRFGLVDGYGLSLSEIGRRMGLSRERVRQINGDALTTLRKSAAQRNLRDYLLT